MVRLRSAINQQQRPTAAILSLPEPQGEWEPIDYALVDSFYTLDREQCTICNNPVWLCHSTDNSIQFATKVRTCYAKQEIEDFEKSEKGKNLSTGEYVIATAVGVDDGKGNYDPLPSRRIAYKKMP